MTDEYDQITSFHYSAYRPPLHNLILDKCISDNRRYESGLDIGCGTGQSSIALAAYCEKVTGIEPSEQMLKKSIIHDKVRYHLFNGIDLDFSNDIFDLITFAGSLYYAKSQRLLDEVIRVSKPNAKIIIYDFDVILDNIMKNLMGRLPDPNNQKYNHAEDFSGLRQGNIQKEITSKDQVSLKISSSEILHLLLATKDYYILLLERYGKDKLENKINSALEKIIPPKAYTLEVNIYFTIYKVIK